MRIRWIDIARGVGIIFVIYGHLLGSNSIRYIFYSFHIPLFFFLSGMFFKDSGSLKAFLRKSGRGLLVPYFIFSLFSFLIWIFSSNPNGNEVWRQFASIFYANSNNGLMIYNDILWFLPVLFASRLIFFFLEKFKDKRIIILFLIFFSIFGFLLSAKFNFIKLPFGIETALSAVVFYGLGFLFMKKEELVNFFSKYKFFIFPVFLVLNLIISTIDFNLYGNQIDMRLGHLHNFSIFYIDAFLGIMAWISFSMILGKNYILELLGRNSLVLFALHPIAFKILFNIKNLTPAGYGAVSILAILFANKTLSRILSFLHLKNS